MSWLNNSGVGALRGALLEPGHKQIVAHVVIRFSGGLERRIARGWSHLDVNGRRGAREMHLAVSSGCDFVRTHKINIVHLSTIQ